jgi:hypothetical protein
MLQYPIISQYKGNLSGLSSPNQHLCVCLQDQASDSKLRILFLSEGNVCRSIFAEAIFSHLIQDQDLQDSVECTSKVNMMMMRFNALEP